MSQSHFDRLSEQLLLADALLVGRDTMKEPQDLPGRYGRVVRAVDKVLAAIDCSAVVGGGWAVWRHGFMGRVTQDLDIVLPADRIDEFLSVSSVSGFKVLQVEPGSWPKIHHTETDIQVDIMPEGERPGRPPDLAPTTIPHPKLLGASGQKLRYLNLPRLVELKIAAGRLKDRADVVELLRNNIDQVDVVRKHLATVHVNYIDELEALLEEANKDDPAR